MATRMLSVCIFCLICATHSPCGSHAAVTHEDPHTQNGTMLKATDTREKFKGKQLVLDETAPNTVRVSNDENFDTSIYNGDNNNNNNAQVVRKQHFLKLLFEKYGNGQVMTMQGFETFIDELIELQTMAQLSRLEKNTHNHHHHHEEHVEEQGDNDNNQTKGTCLLKDELKSLSTGNISHTTFDLLCPVLLYSLFTDNNCIGNNINGSSAGHDHFDGTVIGGTDIYTWLYSICAVCVISACGVLSLFIIPIMQKKFYKPLLQFLVALAVGTLAGDALLHLLPHAMSGGATGGHHDGHDHEDHENMWKGFVAMLGLIVFFVMERFIPLVHRWRKGKASEGHSHVKVIGTSLDINKGGDTKCMDKYNPYPRCYKDIIDDPKTTFMESGDVPSHRNVDDTLNKKKKAKTEQGRVVDGISVEIKEQERNQNSTECPINDLTATNCTEINKMLPQPADGCHSHDEPEADYTVILTEHEAAHHGHSHMHGHVHAAPQNLSSVAWMVIMGDGLHNFTDGMAIGAAFSSSVAGGLSTTVAVFCHELPHEVGDFAMLLKAGMSIKQAFFYNIISSVLCVLGNVLGIWLGNTDYASSWVFAVAAGTFIYIALVDMIPELSSAHEDEGNLLQCILHLSGLLLGFGIMTLIALYEHDLKHIFSD